MTDRTPGVSPSPRPSDGRRVRAPQNLVAGASLIALGLFARWSSADLDAGTLRSMGAGHCRAASPHLVALSGLSLVVLSLVKDGDPSRPLAAAGPVLRGPRRGRVRAHDPLGRPRGGGPARRARVGGASPETRWKELIVFAVAITAFCVGLFRYALQLPIPILVLPGIVTI